MSFHAQRLLALGPKVVALVVLIAALVVAPLTLPAEPEPCCCPQPSKCTCADHDDDRGPSTIRRCGSPTEQPAPIPAPTVALPVPLAIVSEAAAAPAPVLPLAIPHESPDLGPRFRPPPAV
jgi:hypothetical protein